MTQHVIFPELPVGALYTFDQVPKILEKEHVQLSESSTEEFLYACLTECLSKFKAMKVLSYSKFLC